MTAIDEWVWHVLGPGAEARGALLARGLALVLLSAGLAWLSGAICHFTARRLRRLRPQSPAPPALEALAPPLRLVVLLAGLYLTAEWAWPQGGRHARLIGGALFVVAVIVAARGLGRVSRLVLDVVIGRLADRQGTGVPRSQRALLPLSQRVSGAVLWAVALIVVLDHFGQSISSVITALGVGSLAIGLAAQQALSNMIAGLVLLLDKPFRTGDRIRVPGLDVGRVEEMGLRSTHLRLGDGNLLVVPNNDLVAARLINYGGAGSARGEVRLQVAMPGPDGTLQIDELERRLREAAEKEPGIAAEPAPQLLLLGVGEKLDLALVFTLAPEAEAPQVEERMRRAVLRILQAS